MSGESFKKLLITGMGTGYLRPAPGTWGSAAACLVFLAVAWASGGNSPLISAVMGGVAVLASAGCVALGRFAQRVFGSADPGRCNLDEWAGQAAATLFLPLGTGFRNPLIAAGVAFGAFRLFDIVKPPPIRLLERLPAGWGILTDDLAAGILANIAGQAILRLWIGL